MVRQDGLRIMLLTAGMILATGSRPVMTPALAFHQGGVGECDGCHTIHNSQGDVPVAAGFPSGQAGVYLLKGYDATSVCLTCHQKNGDTGPSGYHISTPVADMPAGMPPIQLSPGGDFGWLKKTYTWTSAFGALPSTSFGDAHGHNIVSLEYGYSPDAVKAFSPGGMYPANALSCISCHDPHGSYRRNADGSITTAGTPIHDSGSESDSPDPDAGKSVGVYRLLGGVGYYPRSLYSSLAFSANPPAAVAPTQFNRSESVTPTRVAYGSGMSEWCRNCHSTIHTSLAPGSLTHPAGDTASLGAAVIERYVSYVKTGDFSGQEATSWDSLVPFESGTTRYETLKTIAATASTRGPNMNDGTPKVMCLSCHRAHASGWDGATRWNTKTSAIAYGGKYDQYGELYQPYGQGRSAAESARAYYDKAATTFATLQEGLCFKCHESLP